MPVSAGTFGSIRWSFHACAGERATSVFGLERVDIQGFRSVLVYGVFKVEVREGQNFLPIDTLPDSQDVLAEKGQVSHLAL